MNKPRSRSFSPQSIIYSNCDNQNNSITVRAESFAPVDKDGVGIYSSIPMTMFTLLSTFQHMQLFIMHHEPSGIVCITVVTPRENNYNIKNSLILQN